MGKLGIMLSMTEEKLKRRSDVQIARKVWHVLGVLIIVITYNNVSRTSALQLATFFTLLSVSVDVLRLQSPGFNRTVLAIMGPLMRDYERENFCGTTFLLLGVFIIIVLFPQTIASLALLMLAFADPLASYVGIHYGKDKIVGSKSLQGSMAAFVACTVIAAGYFMINNLMTERLVVVSLIAGIIGSISELIPVGKMDDNFTFPLICSTLLWGLFYLFGGF